MKSNLPLWEQIARNFIEEIQRGVHPLGSLLPTELEVAERFDVSRHTVRTAYAELVRLGYVRRTPRVGTQVINTEQLPNFYYEVESFSNLDPYHNLPPREVLAEADFRYDVDSDTTLPFAEGTQVWRLDFARFGKLPYEVLSFTTAWMPASSKVFRKELFEEPSVPLINQLCRLRADVCQTIDQSVHARLLSA